MADEDTDAPGYWSRSIEKRLQARVQTVLSDPDLLRIFQTFGAEVFRRSSVFHGLDQFLKRWDITGKTCFEIGTWNGLTAIVLARRFEQVVTVDIAQNPIKHEILKLVGVHNVRCIDIRDNDEKSKIARSIKFDCAYMDGNHADDTISDFELMKRGGRVIFQEVWPFQEPVWNLVKSLPFHQVIYGGDGLAMFDESLQPPPEPLPEPSLDSPPS